MTQTSLTPLELHQELVRGIPGARLEVVHDCGHLSALEQPEEVNRAMRAWLSG